MVQIRVGNALRMLDEQKVELIIGDFGDVEKWHNRAALFEDTRQCLFSRRHIKARTPISLKNYLSHGHIIRSLGARVSTDVDTSLGETRQRHVMLTTPRFSNLPHLLKAAPLIATVPTSLATIFCEDDALIASALPFATPTISVSMVWHRINDKKPELSWLRTKLIDAATN